MTYSNDYARMNSRAGDPSSSPMKKSNTGTTEPSDTNHFELLKYIIDHDERMRTTRVWYKNGYNDQRVLMATYPWSVWGMQNAWMKAYEFKQTAVVPL
jgi:hypothetical protein